MKRLLTDYVKIYENAVPKELCDTLIKKFDLAKKETFDNDVFKFNQINLNDNLPLYKDEFEILCQIFSIYSEQYKKELDIKYFPETNGYEQFRIKKYVQGDYFRNHVDVGDYYSARRFLSIFVYLNDAGGTKFFDDNPIKSGVGTLVMFPPLWMFPHRSVIDTKAEAKYFLSTYLHYL